MELAATSEETHNIRIGVLLGPVTNIVFDWPQPVESRVLVECIDHNTLLSVELDAVSSNEDHYSEFLLRLLLEACGNGISYGIDLLDVGVGEAVDVFGIGEPIKSEDCFKFITI